MRAFAFALVVAALIPALVWVNTELRIVATIITPSLTA